MSWKSWSQDQWWRFLFTCLNKTRESFWRCYAQPCAKRAGVVEGTRDSSHEIPAKPRSAKRSRSFETLEAHRLMSNVSGTQMTRFPSRNALISLPLGPANGWASGNSGSGYLVGKRLPSGLWRPFLELNSCPSR